MKCFARNALRVLSVLVFASIVYASLAAAGYISLGASPVDSVSSATAQAVTAEDMKGKYVVFINRELHDQSGTTADWEKFFSFAEDVPLIMEDIECSVAQLDEEGIETAQTYVSRLPENQMRIKSEAGVLLLSKAEVGRFDVMILSESAAKVYDASTLFDRDDILVLEF